MLTAASHIYGWRVQRLGSSFAFQLLVSLRRDTEETQAAGVPVIALFTGIINSRIAEEEAMGLPARNLAGKVKICQDIEEERYSMIGIDTEEFPPVLLALRRILTKNRFESYFVLYLADFDKVW